MDIACCKVLEETKMRAKSRWISRFAASAFVLFLLANASLAQAQYATEIYQDFRGKRDLLPEFRLVGPDVGNVVKAEEEGLRITLPKTRKDNSQNVEVAANFVITGDFEITGTYELLDAEMPTDGWGVGVCVSLADTHDINKFLKVGRYMRPKRGSVFYAEYWTKGAKDFKAPWVKTETRSGQLRLVREGQKVRCLASEKSGADFITVFAKDDFGADDLVHLRFVVSDGNKSSYTIDARLVDLRVRYGDAKNRAQAAVPIVLPERPRSRLNLLVVLAAMLAPLLGFVLFYFWRKRRTEPSTKDAPVEEAAPDRVTFACSACGKKLNAKAESAGKTIKCPRCAQAVRVPTKDEAQA
jgi:DNA-directed RNA polymerase subunit RPC12/RpoP